MDKKPHNNNLLLIILLVISLLLGMIFSYINITFNKSGLIYIAKNIDVPTFVKNDIKINKILEDKKIPIEVFNYVDKNEYEKEVDNYFNTRSISKESIKNLLANSIKEYEKINMIDLYSNIEPDIESITDIIYSRIDQETSYKIDTISNIGIICYLFIILSIIFTILIIIKDKNLLSIGLSYTIVAAVIYLSLKDDVLSTAKNYLNNDGMNYLSDRLSNICSIYFIVGIIILLIYLVFAIRKGLKDLKRSYIDYEWRYR